jgi:hypothetical protein
MKMTELSVKLGALWKKVSPTEKKKCEAIVRFLPLIDVAMW